MSDELGHTSIIHLLFILLIIGSIFEIGLLVFAYVNADEVECNLLWCTFSSSYGSSEYITKSECYINDVEVDCSEIRDKHYCNGDGLCIMNGVCPGGSSDNRTIEDLYRQLKFDIKNLESSSYTGDKNNGT